MKRLVEVILPLPLYQFFTYSIPEELEPLAWPGVRVLVPFREKTLTGLIFREAQAIPDKVRVVKPVFSVLDEKPLLSPAFLNFIFEVSQISFSPVGEIIKAALPPRLFIEEKIYYRLKRVPSPQEIKLQFKKIKRQAQQVVSYLAPGERRSLPSLQRKINYPGLALLLSRMEELGWVIREKKMRPGGKRKIYTSFPEQVSQLSLEFPTASAFEAQLNEILQGLRKQDEPREYLLLGPKARREEFFLELLAKWRPQGRNILILFPEISPLGDAAEKIKSILGPRRLVLLHGELSPRVREANWLQILKGEADVVIGTRSAVFAPLPKLELILVLEEGNEAYINESPYYDTRQVARLRAEVEKATIIFSDSAPSVSLYSRAKEKGCLLRLDDRPLPSVRFIAYPSSRKRLISPELRSAIEEHLRKKGKVVIIINRRGYASFLSCARCATMALCPRCRRPLTLYSKKRKLICHHCRYEAPAWKNCPRCGRLVFEYRGHGLEAVVEEIQELWPGSRVASLEARLRGGKDRLAKTIKAFNSGNLDILVGTRFLVSWVDWKMFLLTVIISPEMILSLPDFRSGERVFRLIQGIREEMRDRPDGGLVVQTEVPDNYVLEAAGKGDYCEFAARELRFRRLLGFPPAKPLVRLVIANRNLRTLARQMRELKKAIETSEAIEEYLGPSILERTPKKHQAQVFLRGDNQKQINSFLWSQFQKKWTKVRVEILN